MDKIMEVKSTGSRDKRNIAHDICNLMQFRCSPFRFQDKKIEDVHLRQIFEAARWTPSAKNLQPWSFLHSQKGSQSYASLIDCLTEKNKRWADSAPMLILSLYSEKSDDGKENFYALHDLGSAVTNMTLQAQELGIAFHLMGGKKIKEAHNLLQVPEGYTAVNIIAVGYYCVENEPIHEDYREEFKNSHQRKLQEAFVCKAALK